MQAYKTFYQWLIFIGLVVFGLYLAHYHGLLVTLVSNDKSYLSVVILGLFALACLNVGRHALYIGQQNRITEQLIQDSQSSNHLFSLNSDNQIQINSSSNEHSLAHEHLNLLAQKSTWHGQIGDQTLLLDRLENRIRRGHETGWFIADLLIRLGLLGTVIGFIFMLGSVANLSAIDLQTLQHMLSNMSSGMRIALYTTLSGLTSGILLSFQYQLLDQGADRLLADIIELSEVHVVKHLQHIVNHSPDTD